MTSLKAKKIVAIYSIVLGALSFLLTVFSSDGDVLTLIAGILLLGGGILLLVRINPRLMQTIFIIVFVIYCISVLGGLMMLIYHPLIGIIFLLTVAIPFAFGVIYFVNRSKEEKSSMHSANENNKKIITLIQSVDEEERKKSL